jgi:hypothetical protein
VPTNCASNWLIGSAINAPSKPLSPPISTSSTSTIWRTAPPLAFMTPIWRTCCASSAEIVLTTKKPLKISERKPSALRSSSSVSKNAAAGCLPGSDTIVNSTVRPLFSNLSRTASATAWLWALSLVSPAEITYSSLNERVSPSHSSVSKVM